MKSHLQSYPCPLQINSFWNLGFLLGITIILQIITGIFFRSSSWDQIQKEEINLKIICGSSEKLEIKEKVRHSNNNPIFGSSKCLQELPSKSLYSSSANVQS